MGSEPDMFMSSEELFSQHHSEELPSSYPSSGVPRQDSDSSWDPDVSQGASLESWDKDRLFLVTMAAIQSLFT
jgi:hypothetical protein